MLAATDCAFVGILCSHNALPFGSAPQLERPTRDRSADSLPNNDLGIDHSRLIMMSGSITTVIGSPPSCSHTKRMLYGKGGPPA